MHKHTCWWCCRVWEKGHHGVLTLNIGQISYRHCAELHIIHFSSFRWSPVPAEQAKPMTKRMSCKLYSLLCLVNCISVSDALGRDICCL